MSRKVWLISDTHFGHTNIIKYGDRPFEHAFDMDTQIKRIWNDMVDPNDIVYHLGDVYFGKNRFLGGLPHVDFLQSLHGRKRLVLGNHDNGKDQNLLRAFEKIMMWRMFPEFKALLTHVPVHPSAIRAGLINYHGHIHQRQSPDGPYKNMSVEALNYHPYLLGVTNAPE